MTAKLTLTKRTTRVKTRHARKIRRGILEGKKLYPNVHGLNGIGWKAFCRETENYLKRLLKEPNPFV